VKRSDLDGMTVLRLIGEKPDDWPGWTANYLETRLPGVPPKVILAKLSQLNVKGLIDWGIAVQGCWLTKEGRQKLAEATADAVASQQDRGVIEVAPGAVTVNTGDW
jgi:hypothetical protein